MPVIMNLQNTLEQKLAWINDCLSQDVKNPLAPTLLQEKELYEKLIYELKVSERRL